MAAAKPAATIPDPYSRPRASIVGAAALGELVVEGSAAEEEGPVGDEPPALEVVAAAVLEALVELAELEGATASAAGISLPHFFSAVLQSS